MTNREYLHTLTNNELAYSIYEIIIPIGKMYNNSMGGVALWLNETYNEHEWVWERLQCYRSVMQNEDYIK